VSTAHTGIALTFDAATVTARSGAPLLRSGALAEYEDRDGVEASRRGFSQR
jgi:hypothetical protein